MSPPDDHGHGHGHGHGHAHEHDHTHAHDHDHPTPITDREAVPRGWARGKLLFFDCFSGVAGDMTIAALHDLGVPRTLFEQTFAALPLEGYQLLWREIARSGIVGVRFDVEVEKPQPHRSYGSIDDMLAVASIDEPVRKLARAIFRRLGEAEARAHRMPLREVHFHEVGAVDAIIDVVGAAAALCYLEPEAVVVSPLPLGRGFVKAAHGVLPLPAPAVVSCLEGAPTHAVDLDAELVTPTGAAIVAGAASSYARWPTMSPERVGYGAGTKRFPDRPNLLRVVAGVGEGPSDRASHVMVEANVDDITGELASHGLAALLEAGALDAWATPITMKKGRPGLKLSALTRLEEAPAVADVMLRETTTIGLRTTPVHRTERPRTMHEVVTRFGPIPVKVSSGAFGPAQVKPEFDACVRAAKAHDVPVRVVLQAAIAAYDGE